MVKPGWKKQVTQDLNICHTSLPGMGENFNPTNTNLWEEKGKFW